MKLLFLLLIAFAGSCLGQNQPLNFNVGELTDKIKNLEIDDIESSNFRISNIKILDFNADEVKMEPLDLEQQGIQGEITGVDFAVEADFKVWKTVKLWIIKKTFDTEFHVKMKMKNLKVSQSAKFEIVDKTEMKVSPTKCLASVEHVDIELTGKDWISKFLALIFDAAKSIFNETITEYISEKICPILKGQIEAMAKNIDLDDFIN